ncbi:unnamed protein product [Musa acuminata subsp. malaccensis]|uniref:(wild Malaysian banana) hypothetical protein n=1 Tax=Musa acuminata subsp. malaccensis TaxID=214687 RepID=A0A804LAT8_MUSAM|nr:PREDICTED: uncharacterized protein LOC103972296 [Musa acuminata subsp. malaccensis]CAG1865373.1 unnamed protein product [Musa acuminata subsp. malaccensis]
MAKHGGGKHRKPENLGNGRITPVQIAFIVDRYLADHHFTATLAAFRSETSNLFSKTNVKEVPKGLMGLDEMLDEYISLKEQRVVLDEDRRRVEMALQGMQEVLRLYHSTGTAHLPPQPFLPSQFVAVPLTPILPALYSGTSGSPAVNRTPVVKYAQPSIKLAHKLEANNSSPMPSSSNGSKRKALKTSSSNGSKRKALKLSTNFPLDPKKQRTQSSAASSATGDVALSSQETVAMRTFKKVDISATKSTPTNFPTNKPTVRGLPVGKVLFSQPSDCQVDSSPRTPPQALQSQAHESDSPSDNTPLAITDGGNSKQQIVPFNCSTFASETLIVSPIKHAGCCAVERSYHISSPYNLNSKSKRGHIKGKLDFDNPDIETSSEEPVAVDSLTPSTEGEMSGNFELDLPDLDILNGDFSFSELLADINLDCDGQHSFAHSVLSHEDDAGNGCSKSDQFDCSSATPIEVVSDNDANIQGY